MRRVAGSLLCAVVLLAGACSRQEAKDTKPGATGTLPPKAVAGAQTYTIATDHPSPAGAQLQFSAFYPRSVRVRPGDTVVFDNQSTQNIHTVTFGVKADRSNQPEPVIEGEPNPAAFAPCYQSSDPSAHMTACGTSTAPAGPSPATPAAPPPAPAYTGQGYWNSGVMVFTIPGAPNPPPAVARTATMKLADTIAPGSYQYLCLLHPSMVGTLEVVGSDADRVTPEAVAKAGAAEHEADQAAVDDIVLKGTVGGPTANVTAGGGNDVTSVNMFTPSSVTVKEGGTVVWTNTGPYEPHTVTFQGTFTSPLDKGALRPGGIASGGRFPGGYAHSGLFGPKPAFPSETFTLTFTKKGSYAYTCILHPGMGGVVQVE